MRNKQELKSEIIGANNQHLASKVANQSLLVGLILGSLVFGIAFFLAPFLLQLLGAKKEVIELGVGYLKIVFGSIIASGVMIIGNWLFIFGLGILPTLGLTGAAWATFVARGIGVPLALERFAFKGGQLIILKL
ncbi:hypothetical protein JCM16358_20180 [Halanaerocella petrolearia]